MRNKESVKIDGKRLHLKQKLTRMKPWVQCILGKKLLKLKGEKYKCHLLQIF